MYLLLLFIKPTWLKCVLHSKFYLRFAENVEFLTILAETSNPETGPNLPFLRDWFEKHNCILKKKISHTLCNNYNSVHTYTRTYTILTQYLYMHAKTPHLLRPGNNTLFNIKFA